MTARLRTVPVTAIAIVAHHERLAATRANPRRAKEDVAHDRGVLREVLDKHAPAPYQPSWVCVLCQRRQQRAKHGAERVQPLSPFVSAADTTFAAACQPPASLQAVGMNPNRPLCSKTFTSSRSPTDSSHESVDGIYRTTCTALCDRCVMLDGLCRLPNDLAKTRIFSTGSGGLKLGHFVAA